MGSENNSDFCAKPVEVFSSKFFELLKEHGHDEGIITSFLIYRARQRLHECGQENLAAEIERKCEGLKLADCLQILREYVDMRDADKIA